MSCLPTCFAQSMRKPSRPAQTMREPSCRWPSRSMRSPTPAARSTSMVLGSSTPARMREATYSRLFFSSTTLDTPARSSSADSSMPAGPAPMIATCVFILAGAGDAPRLEERLQRFAAEVRHHLGIRHALHARELLQAEEIGAVVLQALPVEPAHQALLFLAERLHRRLGILQEQLPLLGHDQIVQEPVEAQALRTALQVEDVLTQRAPPSSPSSSAGSSSGAPCACRAPAPRA